MNILRSGTGCMHSKPRLRIFNPVNVMMEIFDKSVTVLKKKYKFGMYARNV